MRGVVVSVLLTMSLPAQAMELCGSAKRVTCVVDGDTFWLHGEKIRIADIDAPEVHGRCRKERHLAAQATQRLALLLDESDIQLRRDGKDRFGRSLAKVTSSDREIGEELIAEGLAQPWPRLKPWC